MQEPKKTTLRNFDPVLRKFPQESKDPVQDLSDRGVDPRALDEFVFDCINTAMQQQVPGSTGPPRRLGRTTRRWLQPDSGYAMNWRRTRI